MASMAPAVMSRHSIRTRREAPSRSIINDTRRRPIRLPICLGLPPAPLFSQVFAVVPFLSSTFDLGGWILVYERRKDSIFVCLDSEMSRFGKSQDATCFVFAGLTTVRGDRDFRSHKMSSSAVGSITSEDVRKFKQGPDHLLVLVHGIGASPSDWTYSKAVLKKRLGSNFLIYASSCNSYIKTLDGIDRAGRRLADEVLSVIHKTGSLKKISFTAHSLGGLIARYTIAVLYSSDTLQKDLNDGYKTGNPENLECSSKLGSIGGLEPINFITLGTPHLGFIGKKQFPLLLGSPILEKLVPPVAAIFVGRTGRQLFLTDDEPNNPPLLLRMASDSEDLKFIFLELHPDLVGWRTSSIRREYELAKPSRRSVDGYMHVVNVEYCPPVLSKGPRFPSEAATAKAAAQTASNTQKTAEYYGRMEGMCIG
ncbi:Putative serine esterase (DUF676) [Musa troglodytarum]|uniref:Serine esterase (DUF676) n=1 Tax=Musa troglodytarum TaxID=320322 RepID=A0A9E7IKN3_9LILI|nr:Putative serine esterase (DUF676) [Musa troglodytarum]